MNQQEFIRYSRHISIPQFGTEGQEKLSATKVLIVGAGGLGCPMLSYLTAAGIGVIGIIDDDVVDESNLQRQVLYTTEDIGKSKAEVAAQKLRLSNPLITIHVHNERLTSENALEIFEPYDIVADGTDNFPTRYLVNDACVISGKTNVYGSVYRFEGQVSVFNYKKEDGSFSPNYRDLYPEPPEPGSVPNCAEGGVLGVLPGIIGTMQASEIIKIASGVGEPLAGKLLLFDALTLESRILSFKKNLDIHIDGLIDYEQFCGSEIQTNMAEVKEITVSELKEWKDSGKDFQLIDCREQYEFDFCNLQGELIPLGNIVEQAEKISKEKDVVIHCRSGQRSATAILQLQQHLGLTKLYNLKGGILAWSSEIDPSVPSY